MKPKAIHKIKVVYSLYNTKGEFSEEVPLETLGQYQQILRSSVTSKATYLMSLDGEIKVHIVKLGLMLPFAYHRWAEIIALFQDHSLVEAHRAMYPIEVTNET